MGPKIGSKVPGQLACCSVPLIWIGIGCSTVPYTFIWSGSLSGPYSGSVFWLSPILKKHIEYAPHFPDEKAFAVFLCSTNYRWIRLKAPSTIRTVSSHLTYMLDIIAGWFFQTSWLVLYFSQTFHSSCFLFLFKTSGGKDSEPASLVFYTVSPGYL